MEKVKKLVVLIGVLVFLSFTLISLLHFWGFISYVLEDCSYPNYGARTAFETVISWPWYVLLLVALFPAYSLYHLCSFCKEEDVEDIEKN
ncbi:MAG: hypothetical protein PHN91_02690 [Patescibacteria group bacterium]|nr:hypothetical protein [Patescibacteria group bacterium]MDD3434987.1 hypothetical protein [Patescibacteria group bacterium]MDD4466681.1 hypothetical protein [Patescibacteria group bacterium]